MEKKPHIKVSEVETEVVEIDPETPELRQRNVDASNSLANQLGLSPEEVKGLKGLSQRPQKISPDEIVMPVDTPFRSKRRRR